MVDTNNTQDPSIPQAQGSLQTAQDSSPPTVSTAQLQSHLNDLVDQQQLRKSMKRILMSIAIVFIILTGILWILSLIGLIQIFWASISVVVFSTIGAVTALLQLDREFIPARPPSVTTVSLPDTEPPDPLNENFSIPQPSKEAGILMVYSKRSLRGLSITLCQGFSGDTNPYAAQTIRECKIRGHTCYIAVFESLPPGPYTAHIYRREMMATVTISPGKVATIDWR